MAHFVVSQFLFPREGMHSRPCTALVFTFSYFTQPLKGAHGEVTGHQLERFTETRSGILPSPAPAVRVTSRAVPWALRGTEWGRGKPLPPGGQLPFPPYPLHDLGQVPGLWKFTLLFCKMEVLYPPDNGTSRISADLVPVVDQLHSPK